MPVLFDVALECRVPQMRRVSVNVKNVTTYYWFLICFMTLKYSRKSDLMMLIFLIVFSVLLYNHNSEDNGNQGYHRENKRV